MPKDDTSKRKGPGGQNAACKELALRIENVFTGGLKIEKKTVHYIEDTLSLTDLSHLCDIITDPNHSEREPLIELLFFPGESIQVHLESFLQAADLIHEDEDRVLFLLMERNPQATLIFPGEKPVLLTVPPDAAAFFIRKLRISRRLDSRILEAVDMAFGHQEIEFTDQSTGVMVASRIKAMIRHSRADTNPYGIEALCAFLTRFPIDSHDFFSCFSFFLAFLETPGDENDLAEGLSHRRSLYLKGLEIGANITRHLNEKTPEIRILSGARLPYVDTEDLMKKIDIIDRISSRLFL